jgi:hypothetical protein
VLPGLCFCPQNRPPVCVVVKTGVYRGFCSGLFHPCSGLFLPVVFVAAVLPGFSGNSRLFCRKVVLCPEKAAKKLPRPFIPAFLAAFTMFFIKKALQMNFKNILYNYKVQLLYANVFVPVRMGQTGCGIRTASALR